MTRSEAEAYAEYFLYKPIPAVIEGLQRGLRGKRLDDFVCGWWFTKHKKARTSSKSNYGLGRRNRGTLTDH